MNTTPKSHTTFPAKIISCTCHHDFQDSRYGVTKRVHNPCKDGYRCTVCSKVRN